MKAFVPVNSDVDQLIAWLKRSNDAISFSSSFLELDALAKFGEKIVTSVHLKITDNGNNTSNTEDTNDDNDDDDDDDYDDDDNDDFNNHSSSSSSNSKMTDDYLEDTVIMAINPYYDNDVSNNVPRKKARYVYITNTNTNNTTNNNTNTTIGNQVLIIGLDKKLVIVIVTILILILIVILIIIIKIVIAVILIANLIANLIIALASIILRRETRLIRGMLKVARVTTRTLVVEKVINTIAIVVIVAIVAAAVATIIQKKMPMLRMVLSRHYLD